MNGMGGSASLASALLRLTETVASSRDQHLGVDVVNIADFQRHLGLARGRLRARLFTLEEGEFCGQDAERLASTLAGKEAVAKVLGTGFRAGVRWLDVEVLREPTGRPYARLSGGAQRRARELKLQSVSISLCHEAPFAIAVAAGISAESAR